MDEILIALETTEQPENTFWCHGFEEWRPREDFDFVFILVLKHGKKLTLDVPFLEVKTKLEKYKAETTSIKIRAFCNTYLNSQAYFNLTDKRKRYEEARRIKPKK